MKNSKKNKIAFFDIDGTILKKSLTESLFDYVVENVEYRGERKTAYERMKNSVQRWQKRCAQSVNSDEAFVKYWGRLTRFLMMALENYSSEEVKEIGRNVVASCPHKQYIFTKTLIETLRKEGFHLVAISGSPKFLVDAFVEMNNFERGVGQDYALPEGERVYKPSGKTTWCNKDEIVFDILSQYGFKREETIILAAGDTIGDFDMLKVANLSFEINPNASLARAVSELIGYEKADCCCEAPISIRQTKFIRVSDSKQNPMASRRVVETYPSCINGFARVKTAFFSQELFGESEIRDYVLRQLKF